MQRQSNDILASGDNLNKQQAMCQTHRLLGVLFQKFKR